MNPAGLSLGDVLTLSEAEDPRAVVEQRTKEWVKRVASTVPPGEVALGFPIMDDRDAPWAHGQQNAAQGLPLPRLNFPSLVSTPAGRQSLLGRLQICIYHSGVLTTKLRGITLKQDIGEPLDATCRTMAHLNGAIDAIRRALIVPMAPLRWRSILELAWTYLVYTANNLDSLGNLLDPFGLPDFLPMTEALRDLVCVDGIPAAVQITRKRQRTPVTLQEVQINEETQRKRHRA